MNTYDKNLIEYYEDSGLENIILFHGYGADAQDLSSLHQIIRPQRKFNWYFPEGPISVPLGGMWLGKAWWPIDSERYVREKSQLDISNDTPPNIESLRKNFIRWIEQKKISPEKLIIGGFSQGGMLALDLFFSLEPSPKGLLLLSTNLINKAYLKQQINQKKLSGQFLISHGKQDAVLPFQGAEKLFSFLQQTEIKGRLYSFQGGHEIPMNVIQEITLFLNSV